MKITKLTLLSALGIAALVPQQTKTVDWGYIVLAGGIFSLGYIAYTTIPDTILEESGNSDDDNAMHDNDNASNSQQALTHHIIIEPIDLNNHRQALTVATQMNHLNIIRSFIQSVMIKTSSEIREI